jgi:glycosyltransferase involved in cell wall biosynthesis
VLHHESFTSATTITAQQAAAQTGPRADQLTDVSVIIPAHNEAANLPWVLARVPAGCEVILVDGDSTDGTPEAARAARPDIVVIGHEAPGKGAALAAGMAAASRDYIVMIDADGSMDPLEIHGFVGALRAGADVVKGSRYLSGGGSEDLTFVRSLGNKGLTWTFNLLYGQRWSELCYGYAAFSRRALETIGIADLVRGGDTGGYGRDRWMRTLGGGRQVRYGHGFEIEAVLFSRSSRKGLRVMELASYERDRMHGQSHLATFRDGFRVLTAIVRERRPAVWRERRRYEFGERPGIAR